MSSPTLLLEHAELDALRADFETNLCKGRAFVAGASGFEERAEVMLGVVHPESGERLEIGAEVVWVKAEPPGDGVGVQMHELDAEALARFIETGRGNAAPARPSPRPSAAPPARNLYDRIRQMPQADRDTMARNGALAERVAVERVCGSLVWEHLLNNPSLSVQELVRIAKNGSLAPNLLGIILNHRAWLTKSDVQKALLANPRLAGGQINRVLQAMTPVEVAAIAANPGYRGQVRTAAQRMTKK